MLSQPNDAISRKAPKPAPKAMVGRQPIFDRHNHVVGYELSFRTAKTPSVEMTAEDETAEVINDAVVSFGLDKLTHGRRAFIRMTPEFVRRDLLKVLPADRVVVEIPCDQPIDRTTVEACRALEADGYTIALDGFSEAFEAGALLPHAGFVKVDFMAAKHGAPSAVPVNGQGKRVSSIATNVQAVEVYAEAVREGYSHFQGFYFERPTRVEGRAIPRGQVSHLRLLCALNDPNLTLDGLEDLIKHDASLCYRILRTVNSAGFAQSREVTSMRHALLLLGRDAIRRWASLWVMADIGADAHAELVLMASVRGRFCEAIVSGLRGTDAGGDGFLLGMCSLLDVILERPMVQVVEELPLSTETSAALLGRDNAARHLLDCLVAYERGDWNTCLPLLDVTGIACTALPSAHGDALRWAHELTQAQPAS